MIWYCDSSALVKQYVREVGSQWFRHQKGQHHLVSSVLAIVEIPSALARRTRDGSISAFEFHRGRLQFTRHLQLGHYRLIPADIEVIELAALLTYRLPLTAYDAVHLASALHYLHDSATDIDQICFVTADSQLQSAAESEGLKSENPNGHS